MPPPPATISHDYDAPGKTCTNMAPRLSLLGDAKQPKGREKNLSYSRLPRKSSTTKSSAGGNINGTIQYPVDVWDGIYCMPTTPIHHHQDQSIRLEGQPTLKLPRNVRRNEVSSRIGNPTKTMRISPGKFHYIVLKLADFAFVLCVLDCTILPLVTIVLPVVSSGDNSGKAPVDISTTPATGNGTDGGSYLLQFILLAMSSTSRLITHPLLGHWLAIWFVLPVGSLSAFLNYFISHKQIWLLTIAAFGLTCVGLSNVFGLHDHHGNFAHHQELTSVDKSSNASSSLLIRLAIVNHHRLLNVLGCACLLSSNYISRRFYGCVDHNLCNEQNRERSLFEKTSKRIDEFNDTESEIVTKAGNFDTMLWNVMPSSRSLTKRRTCYCHQV